MSGIRKPCLLKIALIFQKTFEHTNFQFFSRERHGPNYLPLLTPYVFGHKKTFSRISEAHADGYHDHKNIEYNDDYDDGCEKH